VDPITLNKLLSVGDTLAQDLPGASMPLAHFDAVVSKHSKAKNMRRRAQDILRVCQDLEWVTIEGAQLNVTEMFRAFVSAWDAGDLLLIGRALAKYAPYAEFLASLQQKGIINLAESDLGRTKVFVAFDTFRFWAVACAHAHLSPFDQSLHWGGEWDYESPPLDTVLSSMRDTYGKVEKAGGFADLGRITDSVCRSLHIAFQAFELKVNEMLKTGSVPFVLAPATIRAPSRLFEIATIRKRSDILRERHPAQLMGHRQSEPTTRWLEFRYLEDGLRINGQLMKLLKWEVSRDTKG
jgi:hypothetical protein